MTSRRLHVERLSVKYVFFSSPIILTSGTKIQSALSNRKCQSDLTTRNSVCRTGVEGVKYTHDGIHYASCRSGIVCALFPRHIPISRSVGRNVQTNCLAQKHTVTYRFVIDGLRYEVARPDGSWPVGNETTTAVVCNARSIFLRTRESTRDLQLAC